MFGTGYTQRPFEGIAVISSTADEVTQPFGSVYTALYAPMPFTPIGPSVVPLAPLIGEPFRLHTMVPPGGFTVAVIVVVCGGNSDAVGEAFNVIEGNGFTNKVAGPEFTVEQRPVSTARKVLVFIDCVTPVIVYVLEVAPVIFTHAVPFHCCHWYAIGPPLAVAVTLNVALLPAQTVLFTGCWDITGIWLSVTVIVNEQLLVPQIFVAVTVTVVVPTLNNNPLPLPAPLPVVAPLNE